jgi:hypothetical protein
MNRRHFLSAGFAAAVAAPLWAAVSSRRFDEAVEILAKAVDGGQVTSAALHVTRRGESTAWAFGKGVSENQCSCLVLFQSPSA